MLAGTDDIAANRRPDARTRPSRDQKIGACSITRLPPEAGCSLIRGLIPGGVALGVTRIASNDF